MQQETKILDLGNGRSIKMPVNYQHFILDYSSNPENKGWDREEAMHIIRRVEEGHSAEL